MNRDERRAFVRKHRAAVFGTNRKSDGPAQSIICYVNEGEDLLVSTMGEREGALQEGRVALRLTPYATFCTPPRHAHSEQDVSEKLPHETGNTLPW